jgi:hypothetical protein
MRQHSQPQLRRIIDSKVQLGRTHGLMSLYRLMGASRLMSRALFSGRNWAVLFPLVLGVVIICLWSLDPMVVAQVREPARPQKVNVLIRYRIRTELNQRIVQYREFIKYLTALGFVDARQDEQERAEDAIDPAAMRLQGVMPSAQVEKLLEHPAVQTVLWAPEGLAWWEQPDAVFAVRLGLRRGLSPPQQQLLNRQVRERLTLFAFEEALGYDTRGNTLIKGWIAGRYLLSLWRDLRDEPSGWLWSFTSRAELPRPLADAVPIRWIEVLPAVTKSQRLAPSQVSGTAAKWDPALRAKLADAGATQQPIRVEALFSHNMEDRISWLQEQLDIQYATGAGARSSLRISAAAVEGVIGNVVTMYFERVADLQHFTNWFPELLLVRLPCPATPTWQLTPRSENAVPLEQLLARTGTTQFHQRGYRGQGIRVVLLVEDLQGVAEQIGKTLPASTRWIDLTTELDPDLQPLPPEAREAGPGSGLVWAQLLTTTAPEAEVVLVRVAPAALFQTAEIVRWVQRRDYLSPALRMRGRELEAHLQRALEQKQQAIRQRQQVLQNPENQEMLRQQLEQTQAALEKAEAELQRVHARYQRFLQLRQALQQQVYGAAVVIHPRAWDAGYPMDGYSWLSRQLERLVMSAAPRVVVADAHGRPAVPRAPLWVQAASAAEGIIWSGLFRDEDGNAVLEFIPSHIAIPPEHWSRELNFLAWRTGDGSPSVDLPAGVAFRCTLQWREPVNSAFSDPVRPLYPFELRLWRQLDPTGQKQASDEMTEVARSAGGPYLIWSADGSAVYEQVLEWTTNEAGRYALVVVVGERSAPWLGALQRQEEIALRMLVETRGGPGGGQVLLRSFVTPASGVGLPADASAVVTIGADSPWQLRTGGPSIPLLRKPDYLLPQCIALGTTAYRGTALGTVLAGGLGVLLRQASIGGSNPFRTAGIPLEQFLRVPEGFLQRLPPAALPRNPTR